MIIDRDFMFANAKAVTTTGNSNVVDMGAGGDAVGQELTFHNVVGADFAGLTSLTIKVQTSDDNSSWKDVVISPAVAAADLVAGADVFQVRVPKGLGRYVRLNYNVSGTGTAGTITSFASKDL
jgi:hypothetical protein